MYYVIILILSATPVCVAFGDEYKNINFSFHFVFKCHTENSSRFLGAPDFYMPLAAHILLLSKTGTTGTTTTIKRYIKVRRSIPLYRLRPTASSVMRTEPATAPAAVFTPKPASATSLPDFEDMFSGASWELISLLDGESCSVFSSVSGPECCTPLSCMCTSGGSWIGVGSWVLVVVACVVVDVDVVVVVVVVVVGTSVPFSIQ